MLKKNRSVLRRGNKDSKIEKPSPIQLISRHQDEEVGCYLPSTLRVQNNPSSSCVTDHQNRIISSGPSSSYYNEDINNQTILKESFTKRKRRSISNKIASVKTELLGKLLRRHKRLKSAEHGQSTYSNRKLLSQKPFYQQVTSRKKKKKLSINSEKPLLHKSDPKSISISKNYQSSTLVSKRNLSQAPKILNKDSERSYLLKEGKSSYFHSDTAGKDNFENQPLPLSQDPLISTLKEPIQFSSESPSTRSNTMSTNLIMLAGMQSTKNLLSVKGEKTDKAVTKVQTRIIDIVALVAVAVGVSVSLITSPVLADISCIFLAIFGPYAAYQKRELIELGGFRGQVNILRESVNGVMDQVNVLTRKVDRLGVSVDKLEEIEANLAQYTDTKNVDHLVEITKETKLINSKIKELLEQRIIQDIMTTVIRTDRNLDLKIGPVELKMLILRLKNMPGFNFYEDRFMKVLGENDGPIPIGKIMEVIRNLLDDDVPQEENVFVLDPTQI